jgi:hypothetical protein
VRVRIFRWKAIGPLLLLFIVIAVLVWLFAEPVARQTTEEVSTELLGTEVDVGRLDLIPSTASAACRWPTPSSRGATCSRPSESCSSSTQRL